VNRTYSSASSPYPRRLRVFFFFAVAINYRDVVWLNTVFVEEELTGDGKRCIIVSVEYRIVLILNHYCHPQ
jgi:hypothetical protein